MSNMIKKIYGALPQAFQTLIRRSIYISYTRGSDFFCPICEKSSRKFWNAGVKLIPDLECMWCGSLGRHRLVWLYFVRKTNLFDVKSKKMLHVAPEVCFEKLLRNNIGDSYLTADLNSTRAMVRMDITNIQYPDNSFDVIYCSHVLEHVSNDKQAMNEFYRVLKLGGWAILLVPITSNETFEDPSVVDPTMRLKLFGQEDHVRRYGPDFIKRVEETGFKVLEITGSDFLGNEEITRMGITEEAGTIFYCKK